MLPQWISQMDAAEDARRQALEDSRGEQEYNARVDKKVRVGCQVETSVAAAVAACKRRADSARRTQSNAKVRVDKQTDRADWTQCALRSNSRLCCLLLLLLARAAFVRLQFRCAPSVALHKRTQNGATRRSSAKTAPPIAVDTSLAPKWHGCVHHCHWHQPPRLTEPHTCPTCNTVLCAKRLSVTPGEGAEAKEGDPEEGTEQVHAKVPAHKAH